MKILLVMRHALYLRNYESTISRLAAEGHDITLAFTPMQKFILPTLLEELTAKYPNVKTAWLPHRSSQWYHIADSMRHLRDFLRYLHPQFKKSNKLRERAGRELPPTITRLFKIPLIGYPVMATVASAYMAFLERCFPCETNALEFVRESNPDVFLVTPLVDMTYNQQEYLKAAQELSIPTVLLVASWDNLSNKGLIQIKPDRVVVWNETQKHEAISMHGMPDEQVVVTGAQLFDQWFDAKPATGREEYCRRVGTDSNKPIFLYVCSSIFIAREEVNFVRDWIRAIRSDADEMVATANIIIRPHPSNAPQWAEVEFDKLDNIVIWPRSGAHPVDEKSKSDYFDSLYHAQAVVGINTSAFIEAGILNKPVLTIHDRRFAETQDGTIHFHYLVEQGLLKSVETLPEHVDLLQRIVAGDLWYQDGNQKFLHSFVRPNGLDRDATSFVVAAILDAAHIGKTEPRKRPLLAPMVLAPLYPFTFGAGKKKGKTKVSTSQIGKRERLAWIITRIFLIGLRAFGLRSVFEKKVVPRLARIAQIPSAKRVPEDFRVIASGLKHKLREIAENNKTIIVGPWLSEVGFEVLYWLPFLKWAVAEFGIDKDRLVIVSRGGAADWYKDISAGRYADAFEFYSPETFQRRSEERWEETGGQKQMHLSAFDKELITKVQEKFDLQPEQTTILHPSLMYTLYRPYWRGKIPLKALSKCAVFARLRPPEPRPELSFLPEKYAAVRFYFRPSFPDTPENRSFITRTLGALAQKMPVVMLNPGFSVDDHADFEAKVKGNIIYIDKLMTPENNLAVQTAVISGAQLFLGTYGGLSYLPPFYGVPSIAFCSDRGHFHDTHLTLAYSAFDAIADQDEAEATKVATVTPFVVLGVPDLSLIEQFLPSAISSLPQGAVSTG